MTSTRVVYYIDTPDGETPVGSSKVFVDILDKLALIGGRSSVNDDGEARMAELAQFAKLYKLRYKGRGYIEEFFYSTIDGRSIHISYTSEKPGAIKIFERIRDTLGDKVVMIYFMISHDDETNRVTVVNTDRDGWFFNEKVAVLVTVNPCIKETNEGLFNALVSGLCNIYYGRDFVDLAHRVFQEHSILPQSPEQLPHVFNVLADCVAANVGGGVQKAGDKLVNVLYAEILPELS